MAIDAVKTLLPELITTSSVASFEQLLNKTATADA
jgi:hypothetical protein